MTTLERVANTRQTAPGCVGRFLAVITALVVAMTIALALIIDFGVALNGRCQREMWRLRIRAYQDKLPFNRRGVDLALVEEGCFPSRGTGVVRRDNFASSKSSTATSAMQDVTQPNMFDSESTAGIDTAANTVGILGRKSDFQHEELESEAMDERSKTTATAEKLKKRKALALQMSLENAFGQLEQMFDDNPNAAKAAYPLSTSASFFPPMPEPTDSESRDWSECGWCNSCVVESSNVSWNATSLATAKINNTMSARGETAMNYTVQGAGRTASRRLLSITNSDEKASQDEGVTKGRIQSRRTLMMTVSLDEGSSDFHSDDFKPRCKLCTGCSAVLERQNLNVEFGPFRYTNEAGASSASVFRASSSKALGGWGVAKTFCFIKRHKDGSLYDGPNCDKSPLTKRKHASAITRMVATQTLAEECGIEDVSVRHWREHIRSSNPENGDKINSDVLFMDTAAGVSVEKLTSQVPEQVHTGGIPQSPSLIWRKLAHDVLNAVDSAKLVRAALFDVLTGQCDRHGQNIFIDTTADITLIDSDQAFGQGWRKCVVDSILIPGAEKYTIAYFGNAHVHGVSPPAKGVNPQVLLDYRCHAPDGKIGKVYPHKFTRCIKWLSEAKTTAVRERYGFDSDSDAEFLVKRASNLLNNGFERTVLEAQKALRQENTTNRKATTYEWPEPCCVLDELREGPELIGYTCASRLRATVACQGGYEECNKRKNDEVYSYTSLGTRPSTTLTRDVPSFVRSFHVHV